jgi:hypothetical protein
VAACEHLSHSRNSHAPDHACPHDDCYGSGHLRAGGAQSCPYVRGSDDHSQDVIETRIRQLVWFPNYCSCKETLYEKDLALPASDCDSHLSVSRIQEKVVVLAVVEDDRSHSVNAHPCCCHHCHASHVFVEQAMCGLC